MVNWVEAVAPLRNLLVRIAGLRPTTVEVSAGTKIKLWGPEKRSGHKPAVVLVHGCAGDGMFTWQFQIHTLACHYDVYVPDLLFFGGSTSCSNDWSPGFQAECLALALDAVGVSQCTVVGFSYGGVVAFKLATQRPEMVEGLVVTGSAVEVTESINRDMLGRLGYSSFREMLMPQSAVGMKVLLSKLMQKKVWLPNCLYKDLLSAAFTYSDDKAKLLEELVVSDQQKDLTLSSLKGSLPQRILLLWGEDDQTFTVNVAKDLEQQFGQKASFQAIKNAGHFVALERPCAYNFHLKAYLKQIYVE